MSLLFPPIKVMAESFMTIKDPRVSSNQSSFLHGDETEKSSLAERRKVEEAAALAREGINGFSFREAEEEDDDGSSQSSSIGALSSSSSDDEEEKGDDAQSNLKDDAILASFDSLEESLPIKRGLSNFFTGKSKSFASLSDAGGGHAKDLVKPENPFNKRRRILMSYQASWRRRASCTSLITSFSPLLSPELVKEQSDEEEEEEGDDSDEHENFFPLVSLPSLRSSFKNPRSLSLSDLQKI